MGMFTGFKADFYLGSDTPAPVITILHWMAECDLPKPELPKAPVFFKELRETGDILFHGGSSYFEFGEGELMNGVDIKQSATDQRWHVQFFTSNKCSGVVLAWFFAWLRPYLSVDAVTQVLGMSIYEESDTPQYVFLNHNTLYSAPAVYVRDEDVEDDFLNKASVEHDSFSANEKFCETTAVQTDGLDFTQMVRRANIHNLNVGGYP